MVKTGKVALMSYYDDFAIPDEFTLIIRGNDMDTIAEYEEIYYEPKERFELRMREDDDDKWIKEHCPEYVETVSYQDGKGIVKIKDQGTRKEILDRILSEIITQAKFYLSDEEIDEIVNSVQILDNKRGGRW